MIDRLFEENVGTGPSITFKDWEFPTAPVARPTPGGFVDSIDIPPPQPAGFNRSFPEYARIEPIDIMNAVHSVVTSFEKGVGVAREVVPGIGGLGDILGQAGRAVETSPVGVPLGEVGRFITQGAGGIVSETIGAIGSRAGQIQEELGQPSSIPIPQRILGTAVLGETGRKVLRGQLDFSTAPRDILDSLAIAGLFPAFKALGLAARATGGLGGVGSFALGATRAFIPTTGANLAEKAGAIAGRAVLATSGLGLTADYALPKLTPNEPWAQRILTNRLVAEDSPWRFPYEVAMTLPLDLFALNRFAKESKLSAWASEKVFGTVSLPHQLRFADDSVRNALRSGVLTKDQLKLMDDYSLRQTAEKYIVRSYNDTHFLRIGDEGFARTSKDLPFTQGEFNARVKQWLPKLYDELGAKRLHQEALETMEKEFGWEGMTEAQVFSEWSRYSKLALEIEPMLPGRIIGVNTVNAFHQGPRALELLQTMKKFDQTDLNRFIHRFPALKEVLENTAGDIGKAKKALEDHRKFLHAEKDPAEIGSIRAEIIKVEKAMDDIDIRLGKTYPDGRIRPEFKELKDELVQLEQRYAVLNAPSYFKLSILEQELDDLTELLVKRPDDINMAKYADLQRQVKAVKEQAAEEHLKTIKTKQGLITAREEEIKWTKGITDPDIVDAEWEVLNEGLEQATVAYYNALMAGSRWTLAHSPSGPVMKLIDKLPTDKFPLDPGLRSPIGKVFDTLFGELPNKKLAAQAWADMRNSYAKGGSTEQGMNELFKVLEDQVDSWGYTVAGQYRSSAFVSIFHLPPQFINNAAKVINREASLRAGKEISIIAAPAGKTVAEVVFQAYPGPLKIFQKQVLGRENINIPYNPIYHAVTRAFYPMLRFFLSPRFLALNVFEAKFIGAGLGGPRFFAREGDDWFIRLANDLEDYGQRTEHGFMEHLPRGYSRDVLVKNTAKLAWTKRGDEVVHSILDTVWRDPRMKRVQEELGTREKWYDEIHKTFKIREGIRTHRYATTSEMTAKTNEIRKLEVELEKVKGTGEELNVRAQLRETQEAYEELASKDVLQKDAMKILGPDLDKYQPFLEAITFQFRELIKRERMLFAGNPSRSVMERTLNSFLLYWPFSYQFKATKILFEFMTSKAFGFPTGSSGAAAWGHMRKEHERLLQDDPEYAAFFRSNEDLFFFMRNFIPVTPEDIGVTLSPFMRVPNRILKGDARGGPIEELKKLYTIGPMHDSNLITEITREQSKPGGLFHDIFAGDE